MRGHNPAWANLPRRKCDDCGKSYKPVQPLRPNTRGFCSGNCRKSYHKHGGAYRKLKAEMQKMMAKGFQESAEQMRRLAEPIMDDIVRPIVVSELKELHADMMTEISILRGVIRRIERHLGISTEVALRVPELAVPSPSPSRPK